MVADFWHKYVVFGLLLLGWNTSSGQQKKSNLDFVDPSIGGVGHILEPTRPTVHLPNSMVRVYPIRKDEMDDQIFAFPLTNASHRLAPLFSLMPVSGEVNEQVWGQRFSFSHEKKTPYFYTVGLDENECTLEFSPAARSGLFKVSFVGNKPHALRLGMDNAKGEINTDGKRIISGESPTPFLASTQETAVTTDSNIPSAADTLPILPLNLRNLSLRALPLFHCRLHVLLSLPGEGTKTTCKWPKVFLCNILRHPSRQCPSDRNQRCSMRTE